MHGGDMEVMMWLMKAGVWIDLTDAIAMYPMKA